jgi:hypothetical protein
MPVRLKGRSIFHTIGDHFSSALRGAITKSVFARFSSCSRFGLNFTWVR